jgi:hypothetical protein
MDLLDRIREEVGDPAKAYRLGSFKPEGRETPPLLLAGVPSSRQGLSLQIVPLSTYCGHGNMKLSYRAVFVIEAGRWTTAALPKIAATVGRRAQRTRVRA